MTSILDSVNERKETINKNYNQDSQVQLIQEYKDAIFSNIDDCREYLSSSNYAPSMNLIYSLDSMKAAIESSNAIDLYTFIETIIDATSTYVVPFSCKGAFDKTVSALSNIADGSMISMVEKLLMVSMVVNELSMGVDTLYDLITNLNTASIDLLHKSIKESEAIMDDLSHEHFVGREITEEIKDSMVDFSKELLPLCGTYDREITPSMADLSNEHFLCGAITYDGEI